MSRLFVIPKGTLILAHLTGQAIPGDFRLKDFEALATSKEVIYTENDVCINPESKECFTVAVAYGLRNSPHVLDGEYWGFRLPENSRGVSFILVATKDVKLKETITQKQLKVMKTWIDQTIPVKPGIYADAADAFLDLMDDEQDRMASEIAKQVDAEIMKSLMIPPIYGAPTA